MPTSHSICCSGSAVRLLVVAALASGCVGTIAAPPGSGAGTDDPRGDEPGSAPRGKETTRTGSPTSQAAARPDIVSTATLRPVRLRRLTATEIQNSLNDVFGAAVVGDAALPRPRFRHRYETLSDPLNVDEELATALQALGERIGQAVAQQLPSTLPCGVGVAPGGELACAGTFLDSTGSRLYRRPLSPDERARLTALFSAARANGDFPAAVAAVVEGMLLSPGFLFRTEYGAAATNGVTRLTSYEVASWLSYGLWRTTPDAALMEAARLGKLDTEAGVQAEARRLLADPRAAAMIADFVAQWLEVDLVPNLNKDDKLFSPALAAAALSAVGALVARVLGDKGDTLSDLLTSTKADANAALAKLYGIPADIAPKTDHLQPVDLDPGRRAGVLTQPAFFMAQSSPGSTSPIFLGLFVRTKLFCQALPPPPTAASEPKNLTNLSTRDKFATHRTGPACMGCHSMMDPIGFGFERYDFLGRYREAETVGSKTYPLTGEGELVATDVDGPFLGPVALAQTLSRSDMVRDCFGRQLLLSLSGIDAATEGDAARASAAVKATPSRDVRDLVLALVSSQSALARDASALR